MTALRSGAAYLTLVATLALLAWATSAASAGLLTPLPTLWLAPGIALWLASLAPTPWFVGGMDVLPRLVRRLLLIATLAISGWSLGTLVRRTYAAITFSQAQLERDTVVGMILGGPAAPGARTMSVMLPGLRTAWPMPFTADAAREAAGHFACVEISIETTADGVARLVTPSEPYDASDLVDCPAQGEL